MTIASPAQTVKPRRARRRAWQLRVDQQRLADFLPGLAVAVDEVFAPH